MKAPEQHPGGLAWSIAVVSLVLPWVGFGLCLAALARISNGAAFGWRLLVIGLALIVLDLVIDFVWAHPSVSRSDQPDLNRRGAQYIGRIAIVEEAITAGRGKVRIGDTLWLVEGPDTARGVPVRVMAANGTILAVERE